MAGYKALAIDLDGTLLDSDLQIRRRSIQALDRVRAQGVEVLIVTGRHHVAAYPYYHQLRLESAALCCNGTYAYNYHQGESSFGNPLRRDQALGVLGVARERGVHALMYVEDAMTYDALEPHLEHLLAWGAALPAEVRPAIERVDSLERLAENAEVIWKLAGSHPDAETMGAFVAEVMQRFGPSCEMSGANRVDIASAGNSKGGLLKRWLDARGILPSEVIAMGDNHNDISMLRLAGLGVAMGQSDAAVKAAADYVTGDNDSDAVSETLALFLPGDS